MTIKSQQTVTAEHLRRQKAASTDPDRLEREARLLEGKMSDSMIESVAAAMKKFVETPLPNATEPPSVIDLQTVLAGCLGDVWRLIARVAIEALRNPPDHVLGIHDLMDVQRSAEIRADWNRTLDAILAADKR